MISLLTSRNIKFIRLFLYTVAFFGVSLFVNNSSVYATCRSSCTFSQCPAACGQYATGSFWISNQGGESCPAGQVSCTYWTQCCTVCTAGQCGGGTDPGTETNCEGSRRCRDGCPDWWDCGSCPSNCVCKEDCWLGFCLGGDTRACGQVASYYGQNIQCGSSCDPGCADATTCGKCGNPACCTVTAPGTPVLATPTPGAILTRAASVVLDWNDVAWGTDCNNAANFYAVEITNGSASTLYPTPSTYTYAFPAATAKCNVSVSWRAVAYNGATWGAWSGYRTFTNTGFTGPTTTIATSTSAVSYPNSITFNATAADPDSNLSWLRLKVDRINGWGTGTTSMTNVYTSANTACSGAACSANLSWSPTLAQGGYHYVAYVESSDSCGYLASTSSRTEFEVAPTYNLVVDVKKTALVLPDENGNVDYAAVCSSSTSQFANVSVMYTAVDGVTTRTVVSNASGIATFSNIPATHIGSTAAGQGLTITASPVSTQACEKYGFYCINSASQIGQKINFAGVPVGGTKNITISLGEEKKDSWETVFDGDIYAKEANVSVSCSAATVGGNFEPVTIVDTTSGFGGFFKTAGALNADNNDDIYTGEGGYAKNLNGSDVNSGKSYDVWFKNFTFPTDTTGGRTISSLAGIVNASVYRSGDLTISGNYNLGASNRTAIVYVDGNLTISGNVTSSNGFIIFVVKDNVTVNPSVGIANYTVGSNFTTTTAPNITAGIISLGSIAFPSVGSAGDNPVIIDGFLMSKGLISFNRDLLANNDRYPAHVIKFNQRALSMITLLEETVKTGLATYDVQWIYE